MRLNLSRGFVRTDVHLKELFDSVLPHQKTGSAASCKIIENKTRAVSHLSYRKPIAVELKPPIGVAMPLGVRSMGEFLIPK